MRIAKFLKILCMHGLCVLLFSLSTAAFSDSHDWLNDSNVKVQDSPVMMLADAESDNQENGKPRSGTLVLPAAAAEEKSEKKCMTVCQRWGQTCMIDNARGVRKCRRTCKEFGQECF